MCKMGMMASIMFVVSEDHPSQALGALPGTEDTLRNLYWLHLNLASTQWGELASGLPEPESPQERPGSRRSLPGSLSEKNPSMEPSATTPFRVTVTISASPSPPGLGCHSATPRAPFLEPHGPGEHSASLVLGLPQPPPQGLHQAHQEPAQAGPQPQLPPHPAGVPERRRRHRRRRRRRGQ
uniref:Disabled homolog 2-interacting protein n=1 Tax=Lynx canadensis TaxID=61383 RepID=A0A667HRB5_LYNCA